MCVSMHVCMLVNALFERFKILSAPTHMPSPGVPGREGPMCVVTMVTYVARCWNAAGLNSLVMWAGQKTWIR